MKSSPELERNLERQNEKKIRAHFGAVLCKLILRLKKSARAIFLKNESK